MNNTTMDKLAVGSVFGFGHNNPTGRFEKVSNLYARDLWDDVVRPNATNANEAEKIEVTYHERETR